MSDTRSVETTAADIETAIQLGLEQLGVSRESVIVEILEEPSRGLLGLGARQARIRLTTAAPPRHATPPPEEHHPTASQPAPAVADPADQIDTADDEPEPESEAGLLEEEEAVEDEISPPQVTVATTHEPLDEDAEIGLATLQDLLVKMQIDAKIDVQLADATPGEDPPWVLQIRGRDLGMLIGRRGETLSALQYITRLIASRELQHRANIVLDVEGYKQRREQMLRRLAGRMADQALQLGRTVSMEPMSPYERRIIHLELRDHPDVTTESVGEGDHRKVTIIPRRR